MSPPPLLAISDRRLMSPDPLDRMAGAMRRLGPALALQLREKDLEAGELHRWCAHLAPIARATGCALFINGRADLARCFDPPLGLHLPEDGLPIAAARSLLPAPALISVAAHSVEAAIRKGREGADWVVLSPIFASPGKGPPLGLDLLQAAVRGSGAQLYALGGVGASNVQAVRRAGAGAAAIRAFWSGELEG